ncbi:MAG: transcriptional repressor [Prevotella sp.]|jgi:Fur family ferric uptake transcriptional regulator|nr:transcriptional repressor [Prevotella sp.]
MTFELSDEQTLIDGGIRVTAVRLLVLRTIKQNLKNAFGINDLEQLLPTVDRSTLFRTLNVLTEGGLLHEIDDGTGAQKYCICHCEDHHHHRGHVHLTCTECHQTFCLRNVEIPAVPLPTGFTVLHAEYVVKGLCTECQNKHK